MNNDWSKISTGDLITLSEFFEQAIENENEDGTFSIQVSALHWSRCVPIKYEIVHELEDRADQGLTEN